MASKPISALPAWTGEVPDNAITPVTISGVTYGVIGPLGGGSAGPISFQISSDDSYLEIYFNGVLLGKVGINT